MKHTFNIKLSVSMMLFAMVISISLAITNYLSIKADAVTNERRILEEKLNLLRYALETSEHANLNLNQNIEEHLQTISSHLQSRYARNPQVETWNFERLSQFFEIDIYIINSMNEITYSNVVKDIGLNFNKCCSKLAEILDQRRVDGQFYMDGFDIEQATGQIKSYSYMGTPDGKYIIQLGYSWDKDPLFEQFNFLNTIKELRDTSDLILDVHVLNMGGLAFGESEFRLAQQGRAAFEHTLKTGENSSYQGFWNDQSATYLYSKYVSSDDLDSSQTKVIQLIYDNGILNEKLSQHKEAFIYSILIILVVTIILSLLISRWVAKPFYMAFHDHLTSLGNRAYFEDHVNKKFVSMGKPFSFIIIDVDNFKQVNDTLGHDMGDKLLQQTAMLIKDAVKGDELAFRFGGDEFIIVLPTNETKRAQKLAKYLASSFQQQIGSVYKLELPLSLSIGISYSDNYNSDLDMMLRKADQALYSSKKSGKNMISSLDLDQKN